MERKDRTDCCCETPDGRCGPYWPFGPCKTHVVDVVMDGTEEEWRWW